MDLSYSKKQYLVNLEFKVLFFGVGFLSYTVKLSLVIKWISSINYLKWTFFENEMSSTCLPFYLALKTKERWEFTTGFVASTWPKRTLTLLLELKMDSCLCFQLMLLIRAYACVKEEIISIAWLKKICSICIIMIYTYLYICTICINYCQRRINFSSVDREKWLVKEGKEGNMGRKERRQRGRSGRRIRVGKIGES